MNSLGLSPLPSTRTEDTTGSFIMERDGFVDEAVVSAMVTAPLRTSRNQPLHADLALCADDFAGWQFPVALARVALESTNPALENIARRATAPAPEEDGLGTAHQGSHRWWLAGLAGVLSTMLFSLLLISLSNRTATETNDLSTREIQRGAPVVQSDIAAKSAPELSGSPQAAR